MKIKRSVLEKIVREELFSHLRTLREDEEKKKPEIADASAEPEKDEKPKKKDDGGKKGEKPRAKADPGKKPSPKDGGGPPKIDDVPDDGGEGMPLDGPPDAPPELPVGDEPADDELDDGPMGAEDADEVTGGDIADELMGQSIQSLTMEPKSKMLPGAQEIVLQFQQTPDPLHILITKTGEVKFFYRGAIHNTL